MCKINSTIPVFGQCYESDSKNCKDLPNIDSNATCNSHDLPIVDSDAVSNNFEDRILDLSIASASRTHDSHDVNIEQTSIDSPKKLKQDDQKHILLGDDNAVNMRYNFIIEQTNSTSRKCGEGRKDIRHFNGNESNFFGTNFQIDEKEEN